MKRFLTILIFSLALASFLPAQEHEGPKKEGAAAQNSSEYPGEKLIGWKWANFVILAAGLGYLIAKNVPPFFRSRTEEIQSGIREASRLKAEADATMAEVERQYATLGTEIESLKTRLKAEMAAEGTRIQQDTEKMLTRIHQQADQEIAFITKAARNELRSHAANLALDLAKGRIANRMNAQTQQGLVSAFVHDLGTEAGAK
jgi:F-type H+-transporting ATPase subunit b